MRIQMMGCAVDNLDMDESLAVVEGFIRSGFEQQLCPAFGAGKHIVVMLGFGTDAWNANEAEQVFQHFRLVLCNIFLYFHR